MTDPSIYHDPHGGTMAANLLHGNTHLNTVRGSGMTTALAFNHIATALANPGWEVHIQDHHKDGHMNLFRAIKQIVSDTHLTIEFGARAGYQTMKAPIRGKEAMQYVQR